MALIMCPECNWEISDKSEICIHCGFPLNRNKKYYICNINGIDFDLSEVLVEVVNMRNNTELSTMISDRRRITTKIQNVTQLQHKSAATLCNMLFDNPTPPSKFNSQIIEQKEAALRCPKCGSTSIATGARGVNWTRGLIGASKTVNRCQSCGYTWNPATGKKA